ncbi:retrotransposon protein, partial [Trifolium medium]|nr:retrotransposon protein [Trifolium medium]
VIQTPEQQFYLAKLLGYTYEIIYKPGAQNRVADALSRAYSFVLSVPHWDFITKLKESIALDSQVQQLMAKVQQEPEVFSDFKVLDNLLYFKGKLFIPTTSSFKQLLLEEFHSSPIGGHSGVHKTYGRLKENVFWYGIKRDVTEFVKSCMTCQQIKPPNALPLGHLQPLPIPERVWEDISLDFITGLPSFQNHTVLLVVVDRLSKAAHFGMLPTHFTAVKVAELFI